LFQLPGAKAPASLPDGVGLTSPDVFPGITSCAAASLHEMFFPALRPLMFLSALRPGTIFAGKASNVL